MFTARLQNFLLKSLQKWFSREPAVWFEDTTCTIVADYQDHLLSLIKPLPWKTNFRNSVKRKIKGPAGRFQRYAVITKLPRLHHLSEVETTKKRIKSKLNKLH